jgi:dTMP kinase
MNSQQFFIAFEGLDGAGKSTLFEKLGPMLEHKTSNKIIQIDKKFPPAFSSYSDHHIATIRSILWEYQKDAPMTELGDMHWLYLLASWFHVIDSTQIKPSLANGHSILMESWCYKYLVRYRLKADFMYEAMLTAFYSLTRPSPIIYIDVDPHIAAERKTFYGFSESGGMDGLQGNTKNDFLIYQNTLRQFYLDFASQNDWIIINSDNNDVDSLALEIIEALARSGVISP